MRRILGQSHVYLEVTGVSGQSLQNILGGPVGFLAAHVRQDGADLVVPEAGADGSLRDGSLHGLSELVDNLTRVIYLTHRNCLCEMGDVEDGDGESVVRGEGLGKQQSVEEIPIRQPSYEVGRCRPSKGLLHL